MGEKLERVLPRILVVEDDALAVAVYRRALSTDAELEVATCLTDAREWLRRMQFDGVIIDFGLPDGDGRELARELLGGLARGTSRLS